MLLNLAIPGIKTSTRDFNALRKAIERVTDGKCPDGHVRIYRSVSTNLLDVDNFYIGIKFVDKIDDKETGYLYGYTEYAHIYTNDTKIVESRFEQTPQEAIDCGFVNPPYLSRELQEKIKGVVEDWLVKV
jgi:hypothetical protein